PFVAAVARGPDRPQIQARLDANLLPVIGHGRHLLVFAELGAADLGGTQRQLEPLAGLVVDQDTFAAAPPTGLGQELLGPSGVVRELGDRILEGWSAGRERRNPAVGG